MHDSASVTNAEWDLNGSKKLGKILGWTPTHLAKYNSFITQENEDKRRDFLKSFKKDIMKVHDDQLTEFKDAVLLLHTKRRALEEANANTASSKSGMFEH